MSNSARIGLPFLDAAQAQKHVTVNEALARLDIVSAGLVGSMDKIVPPTEPVDGDAHIVPIAAASDWSGQDGKVAIFLNGGWDFIVPWAGWRLWVADRNGVAVFDGFGWRLSAQHFSAGGALTASLIAETDHVVEAGAASQTAAIIPDKAMVLGVTGRVTSAITGASSWQLGVNGSPDRYGSGYGVAAGSFAHGVSGTPLAYYGGASLLLTAQGGSFSGGSIRLAVHYIELSPPRAA